MCDVNRDRADNAARKWGASEIYYDINEIVRSKSIDAIIVATSNKYHREAVIAAAMEKKHVLCEKPIATKLTDAEQMITACEKGKICFQIGFSERFWNQTEIVKSLIEQKAIGEIYGYHATWNEKWGLFPAATEYRYDLNLSGGACIIDLGVHRIDLARHFVGEIERVCADVRHVAIPHQVDDSVWILCGFKNGASGCISANRFSPVVSNPIEIYGTEGTIFVSLESFNPFPFGTHCDLYRKRPF